MTAALNIVGRVSIDDGGDVTELFTAHSFFVVHSLTVTVALSAPIKAFFCLFVCFNLLSHVLYYDTVSCVIVLFVPSSEMSF